MRQARLFFALPDFELPEGKNAVAIAPGEAPWVTRYLRHPGDSVNQFNWNHPGTSLPIYRVDINNDGYMDYLAGENIYYGRGEGLQPSPEPVRVGEHNFNGYFVDVNGDGLPDAVNGERIVIGNTDFSKNREIRILPDSLLHKEYAQNITYKYQVMYGSCWQGADGSVRYAVWYSDNSQNVGERYHQTLCLYRLRYKGEVADLELLDRLESYGAENGINLPLSAVFQPEGVNGREFMFVLRGGTRTELYAIENDKWVYKTTPQGAGGVFLLSHSINGDASQDWLYNNGQGKLIAYSGKALPNIEPLFIVPIGPQHRSLGDVNGDGFNDVGFIGGPEGKFGIYLGRSSATSVSAEEIFQEISIAPNPATGAIHIQGTLIKEGKYTFFLTDIQGNTLAMLHTGWYEQGVFSERFDISSLGLAQGTYFLRLTGHGTFVTLKFLAGGK
jgi:hypothetical protein